MRYQVIVGGIGTVVDTDDVDVARRTFHEYTWSSIEGGTRAAGESVTLMRDGEPLAEFSGRHET